MPYHADTNQAEIIAALRAAGCSVSIIAGANGNTGVPDLLVGRTFLDGSRPQFDPCRNFLLEVKRPKAKGQRAGELSATQERWQASWRGQVAVVRTVAEALAAVGLL